MANNSNNHGEGVTDIARLLLENNKSMKITSRWNYLYAG
jgi:hypothetical protein